jgi:hypothetical protein
LPCRLIGNQFDDYTREDARYLCLAVSEVIDDIPNPDDFTRCIQSAADLLDVARTADERLAGETTAGDVRETASVVEALLDAFGRIPEGDLEWGRVPWVVHTWPLRLTDTDAHVSGVPDSASVIGFLLLLHARGRETALPQARDLCERWLAALPQGDAEDGKAIVTLRDRVDAARTRHG